MNQDVEQQHITLKERRGLPGIRGTDHIGFTVPNMKQAHEFFVNVIGCQHVYSLGPYPQDPELMRTKLNVHPEATLVEIRFYRCFNGANFELFNYSSPDQRQKQPRNSDIGGHHIAFYVEDLDVAIDYLKGEGIRVLGDPTLSSGASKGQRWVYFLAPWGMQFELVSFPRGKAYESHTALRLWKP